MPASVSCLIASSRLVGVAARGSMVRASMRSSVVTDSATLASPRSAMRDRMSMSRTTSADLVTMPTGWLWRFQHFQHLAHDPVLLLDRLVGIGVGADGDRARLVAFLGRAPFRAACAASGLANSFDSKSSPGDRPI